MIFALDYNNYKFEKLPDGQFIVVNLKVKEQQEQNPNRDKEMRIHYLLLKLPQECRKVLDANKVFTDEYLDAFWDQWHFLWNKYLQSQEEVTSIEENRIGYEAVNAISAYIPVFLCHDSWYAKNSEKEQQIVMAIDYFIQNSLIWNFNFGQSHDLSWELFIIEAIALLWCRYPKEKKWRELIARDIITHNLKVIQKIFLVISRSKLNLNDDFLRLRRLAIEWAYLKPYSYALQRAEVRQEDLQKAGCESNDWRKKKIQYFIEEKSLPLPENWGECNEIDQLRTLKNINHNGYVAMDVICSANLWLPPLNGNLGEVDRKDIVNTWHNIVNLMVLNHQNKESYRDDLPSQDEYRILDQIGTILPYLKDEEKPHLLWQPIFDLSERHEIWADRMLHHVHDSVLRAETLPDFYIPLVHSLVSNVLEVNSKVGKWSSYKNVWEALIGICEFNKKAWEEKNIKCVNDLKDVYLLWMEHVPINAERLSDFAS